MPFSGAPAHEPIRLGHLLDRGLARDPDAPALTSTAMQWTWRELDDATRRLAGNLLALGLKPGDRVASLMPNRIVLFVHYLACLRAGLVLTPLNYRYAVSDIDHALAVSKASILLHHRERQRDIDASEQAAGLPLGAVIYDEPGAPSPAKALSFAALLDEGAPLHDLPEPDPDALAFILFTSGSTGKPKGVTHTHRSFGYLLASGAQSFEMGPDDIILPGISISGMAGIGYSMSVLGAGGRVDVARTYVDDELLTLLRDTRPSIIVMLPAFLDRLINEQDARPDDFRSLRMIICGGDKVSPILETAVREIAGLDITTNYGMTEIGFATSPLPGARRPGSIGKPLAGFTLSIRDDAGNEVPANTSGRLWVSAKSTMAGYWDNPRATAETIVDGWLDTGDVVSVDDDGFLWFVGRQQQIIVHDHANISPQEVEEALMAHDSVALAGVVGVNDPVHGENVRAYVMLAKGAARPTMQALIDFARARVGYKAPEDVIVLDEMPFNATGKVDRHLLKEMAARDQESRKVSM